VLGGLGFSLNRVTASSDVALGCRNSARAQNLPSNQVVLDVPPVLVANAIDSFTQRSPDQSRDRLPVGIVSQVSSGLQPFIGIRKVSVHRVAEGSNIQRDHGVSR